MQAELIKTKQELPDVLSLWFERPDGFRFVAGDYTELSLGVAGVADRRWLSIASAPVEDNLQFTVKLGQPLSKFKSALMSLKPGQSVSLSPPMGNFNPPNQPDKLLFIAGGVGITPFRSILIQESAQPVGHDIDLIYIAKPKQVLFEPELSKTSAKTTKLTSGNTSVYLNQIKLAISDIEDRFIFLAGPQPMMEGFYNELVNSDHPRWRLRLCYFDNYNSI